MLEATCSSKVQVVLFLKKESNSIYLGNFFKAKLRAITIETNKMSALKYKLDTMESELSLKKKKKEVGDCYLS